MSRACSSSLALRNRFKGFVTVRKCSALPLYVLWSQYGFSMSILRSSVNALTFLFRDILPILSATLTPFLLLLSGSHRLVSHSVTATRPTKSSYRFSWATLVLEYPPFAPDGGGRFLSEWWRSGANSTSRAGHWTVSLFETISSHRTSLFSASHPFDVIIDNVHACATTRFFAYSFCQEMVGHFPSASNLKWIEWEILEMLAKRMLRSGGNGS